MCIKQRTLRRLAGLLLCLNLLPLAMAEPVVLDGASQFALHSRHTGRDYRIYLSVPAVPPPAGGYPVLYVLDGDASFARLHQANPREASVFERLRQHGPVVPQPGVVVGIGYGRPFSQTMDWRAEDYTPPLSCQACELSSPRHGGADAFARFINEELKPEVARRLPLNPARQSLFGHFVWRPVYRVPAAAPAAELPAFLCHQPLAVVWRPRAVGRTRARAAGGVATPAGVVGRAGRAAGQLRPGGRAPTAAAPAAKPHGEQYRRATRQAIRPAWPGK